jgi:hypothetical protein
VVGQFLDDIVVNRGASELQIGAYPAVPVHVRLQIRRE